MERKINIWAIVVFYVIAITCRFIAVKTDLLAGIDNQYLIILLRGVGPALGALVAITLFSIPNQLSLKGIYSNIALPFAVYWLLPAVLITTVYYFVYGKFPLLLTFTVLVYGLLEEIGWRGFLQEQLKTLPGLYANIIIALLWFVWHVNIEMKIGSLIFLGIIFFGTWGIGKVYSKTSSLLAVAAVHSLNNFFREGIQETELILIVVLLAIWIGFIILYDRKTKAKLSMANE